MGVQWTVGNQGTAGIDDTPSMSFVDGLATRAPEADALMNSIHGRAMDGVLLGRGWSSFSQPINVASRGEFIHEPLPDEIRDTLLGRLAYDRRHPKNPLRLIFAFGESFGEVASDGREELLGLDGDYLNVNAWRMTLAPLARPVDGCGYAFFVTLPLRLRDVVSNRLRTVPVHVDVAKVEVDPTTGAIHFVGVERPVATNFGLPWYRGELEALIAAMIEKISPMDHAESLPAPYNDSMLPGADTRH